MRAFAVVGAQGSGKTRLVVRLVRHFRRAGLRVGTLKHAPHGFDVPGKDSHAHFTAGADVTVLASDAQTAVFRRGGATLRSLLAGLRAMDVVIVEGFRASGLPCVEVWRRAAAPRPRGGAIAIVTDDALEAHIPVFRTRETARLARALLKWLKRTPHAATLRRLNGG